MKDVPLKNVTYYELYLHFLLVELDILGNEIKRTQQQSDVFIIHDHVSKLISQTYMNLLSVSDIFCNSKFSNLNFNEDSLGMSRIIDKHYNTLKDSKITYLLVPDLKLILENVWIETRFYQYEKVSNIFKPSLINPYSDIDIPDVIDKIKKASPNGPMVILDEILSNSFIEYGY